MLEHRASPIGEVKGAIVSGRDAAITIVQAFMRNPNAELGIRAATDGETHFVAVASGSTNLMLTADEARAMASGVEDSFRTYFGRPEVEGLDDLAMGLRQVAGDCDALTAADAKRAAKRDRRAKASTAGRTALVSEKEQGRG